MRTYRRVEAIRKRWLYRADGKLLPTERSDKGTKTSGNWGHKGIPGHQGGSQPGGGHNWLVENRDTFRTNDGVDHATRWLKTSKKIVAEGPKGTKKFLERYAKEHGVDLKAEGKKYEKALSTVQNFEKIAPDKKDGTFSINPPHDEQKITRGFSVTFHQNNKADDPFGGYDPETYGQMCAVAKRELSDDPDAYPTGGPYVGHFGNPELSFVADDVDNALEFAVQHNQHSIWDNKAGMLLINPFYKPELNPIEGHD